MLYCVTERQINDFLNREDEAEMKAEYEQRIIDEKREFLEKHLANLTIEQLDAYLRQKYDFDLVDYIEDHIRDDGTFQFFVLRRNDYYRKAILNVLDELDFSKDITHQMEVDAERALGI